MARLIAACVVEFCPDEPERLHHGNLNDLDLLLPLCPEHGRSYERFAIESSEALGLNLTCQGCGFRTTTWAYQPLLARRSLLAHADRQGRCPIAGIPVDPA